MKTAVGEESGSELTYSIVADPDGESFILKLNDPDLNQLTQVIVYDNSWRLLELQEGIGLSNVKIGYHESNAIIYVKIQQGQQSTILKLIKA